jgi:shikimate kinase
MLPLKRVYIIGFMGSGKTTAGKKIASKLGWNFIDLDHEIEKTEGKAIRDIFSESGEAYFRQRESEILKQLVITRDTIISAGGGTPCFGKNMEFMLETGKVVYLRLTPQQLVGRLEKGTDKRPLVIEKSGDELLQYITMKLIEREEFYLKAGIIIDSIDPDIDKLCDKICN